MLMHAKYLGRKFFKNHYHGIVEINDYYGLGNLVYRIQSINLDYYCIEFYNNLVKIDDLTYTTRVGGQNIIITPNVLRDHLGFNP